MIVVDNASKDNTVSQIKAKYPWVRVIEKNENLGFGKAHNIVIRNTNSTYCLIVNPDIELRADTISEAIHFLKQHPDVCMLTPCVLNPDGTQQYLPKKNPAMKYLIGGLGERYLKRCAKLRDEYTMKNQMITKPIEVEFCTGAFMVAKTDALHMVGGFDERYFLYFEDADLTREIRKIGKAVYHPDVVVIHKWHRDNKKIGKSFGVALLSLFTYMKKWRGDSL